MTTRIIAAVLALLGAAPVMAEPVAVRGLQLGSFTLLKPLKSFGALEWRGGLELTSGDKRFGGLSSLALSADGTALLAVSDAGRWFSATLTYDGGELAGLSGAARDPILDAKGKTVPVKWRNDAEALALWEPGRIAGRVIVGFENLTRAGIYDFGKSGPAARFQKLPLPEAIAGGPANQELEAIGRFPSGPWRGRFIAISENNRDENGDLRAWIFGGGKTIPFAIKPYGGHAITDVAFLPGGGLVTVERSFGASRIPGLAIRRFRGEDIVEDGSVKPVLLMEAAEPIHAVDNMEGIAVHQQDGETRLTIVSDDNFNGGLQRTLLLQFALKE